MNCAAYNTLRDKALSVCGSGGAGNGYADCACGVYLQSDCGSCLLATFSYHAEGKASKQQRKSGAITDDCREIGTAVYAPNGDTSEPETPGFYYNGHTEFRRGEEGVKERNGLEKRTNFYPYPKSYTSQSAPSTWTLGYLGSCSSVCS